MGGNDHNYERFAKQTPDGFADPFEGIRQFVVGTGGRFLRPVSSTPEPNSEALSNTTTKDATPNDWSFGILRLELMSWGYNWEFVPATPGGLHRHRHHCVPLALSDARAQRVRVGAGGMSARAMEASPATQSAALTERQITVSGLRTRLFEAGPADATEAVVFVHGNPGSAGDWKDSGRTHRRLRALCRIRHAGVRACGQAAGLRVLGARGGPVPRRGADGARHRARALRAARPRRTVGHSNGRRAIRNGSRASCCSTPGPSSTTAGTSSRASGRRPCSASCSWQPPTGGSSARSRTSGRSASCRASSSTRCTTTSTATPATRC